MAWRPRTAPAGPPSRGRAFASAPDVPAENQWGSLKSIGLYRSTLGSEGDFPPLPVARDRGFVARDRALPRHRLDFAYLAAVCGLRDSIGDSRRQTACRDLLLYFEYCPGDVQRDVLTLAVLQRLHLICKLTVLSSFDAATDGRVPGLELRVLENGGRKRIAGHVALGVCGGGGNHACRKGDCEEGRGQWSAHR